MSAHVVVVGGGIFGVAAAWELAGRGYSVTLVDQGAIPHPDASSTDISKVVRLDYGSDTGYMTLMERALAGWRRWNERWARELFHETGFLVVSRRPMAPGSFEWESFELLGARGHSRERLSADEIGRRFPAWKGGGYVDGYFNPVGGWAESGAVVRQLAHECANAGVRMLEGARVESLIEHGSHTGGVVISGGERIESDGVVLASGAWSPSVFPVLARLMTPIAQTVMHFKPHDRALFSAPAFPVWTADVSTTGWYGFPCIEDGRLKIANHGPGRPTEATLPRDVPEDAEATFRRFLAESLPSAAAAPRVGARVCLYCDTFDGDFLIDEVPGCGRLVAATGGSGHAFKFAPVLGGLIADAVDETFGRTNIGEAGRRFRWREPTRAAHEQARYAGNLDAGERRAL